MLEYFKWGGESRNLVRYGLFIIVLVMTYSLWQISQAMRVWNFVASAGSGNIVEVRQYLDAGMKPDQPRTIPTGRAIQQAALNGHYDVVVLLLDRGSNPTYGIRYAILGKHSDVVELLIMRGANIRKWTGMHTSPMKYAEEFGNRKIVRIMREAGAQ